MEDPLFWPAHVFSGLMSVDLVYKCAKDYSSLAISKRTIVVGVTFVVEFTDISLVTLRALLPLLTLSVFSSFLSFAFYCTFINFRQFLRVARWS